VVTLLAGVYVDRRRRRPVLIQANVGRALLIALVPLAAFLELLRMELLYAVAFLVGVMAVFFDVAYPSYVPSLVGRTRLTRANSRLEASRAAADVGGPGVGGLLVQLATAPIALLVDAVSFLFSAVALSRIRSDERQPRAGADHQPRAWAAIREGLRFTTADRYLRPIAGEAATFNLFAQTLLTVFLLYAVREIGLSPGGVGIIMSTGAAGAFAGAAAAALPERRFGLGPTIAISILAGSTVPLALPFISGTPQLATTLFALVFFVWGLTLAVYNVHAVSLRHATTPERLLGRMNASYRFFTYGAVPLGALLGGFLGDAIGLRPTLFVGAAGLLLSLLWIASSPVPRLRSLDELAPHIATRPSRAESQAVAETVYGAER